MDDYEEEEIIEDLEGVGEDLFDPGEYCSSGFEKFFCDGLR